MRAKNVNETSYSVRGAIFEVYNELGPGLLESIYEAAMIRELKSRGHEIESQVPIDLMYKGDALGLKYRIDLIVDNVVVIELKSVEELHPVHSKQLLSYLKLANKRLGILVNFNSFEITSSIKRLVNNL